MQTGECNHNPEKQMPAKGQFNPEEMISQHSGSPRFQSMQTANDNHAFVKQSIYHPFYDISPSVCGDMKFIRLGARNNRRSSASEVSDLQNRSHQERSEIISSSLRENVLKEKLESSKDFPDLFRTSLPDYNGKVRSFRSLKRTSWTEKSNLSSGSVEEEIAFSYEDSAFPEVSPPQKIPTSACSQSKHPQLTDTIQSQLFSGQQTVWQPETMRKPNNQIRSPTTERVMNSPFIRRKIFSLTDNDNNIVLNQEPQSHLHTPQMPTNQHTDDNFDISHGMFYKPKLLRLRSEPCDFSALFPDSVISGLNRDTEEGSFRREDLKRSMSFDVTLPSHFETLWTGLTGPGNLVGTSCHLPGPRFSRRQHSLHLEGVPKDLNLVPSEAPLQFHDTHSDNMLLQNSKKQARRVDSFCMGICFSNRPVNINEKVHVKIVETNINWSGLLRFGFTSVNPASIRGCELPRYACPDLTSKSGYWAKALGERYISTNVLLHFSVNRSGDVLYGVDGEDKGVFFNGVDTSHPLWVMLDIYGNTVCVEFSYSDKEAEPNANECGCVQNQQAHNYSPQNLFNGILEDTSSESLSPPLIHWHSNLDISPIRFHSVHGRNVIRNSNGFAAARLKHENFNTVVFTDRPIGCEETLFIQVLAVQRSTTCSLGFGLTVCDPAKLEPGSLPDDSELLLDRNEYWVVNKDVCCNAEVDDEWSFCVSENGEVRNVRNNEPPVTLMHVDTTLRLWAFFDIYGNVSEIRLIGTTKQLRQSQDCTPSAPIKYCNIKEVECATTCLDTSSAAAVNYPVDVADQAYMASPYSVVVANPEGMTFTETDNRNSITSSVFSTDESTDYVFHSCPSTTPSTPMSCLSQATTFDEDAADCKVCWERVINSVIYTCGHMCLCFECAVIIRSEKGLCPICRQSIVDVIKIYKS